MAQSKTEWWLIAIGHTAQKTLEYSDWINERLKGLDYKKTQWDKIKHERYVVIEDKYRK